MKFTASTHRLGLLHDLRVNNIPDIHSQLQQSLVQTTWQSWDSCGFQVEPWNAARLENGLLKMFYILKDLGAALDENQMFSSP